MTATLLVLLPMLAAAAAYPLGRKTERGVNTLLIAATALELLLALGLFFSPAAAEAPGICGEGVHLVSGGMRSVMCLLTAFMWCMTALASPEYFAGARCNARYFAFCLWTLGALEGVFLAGDFLTLLIFFEIMSFPSYVWVVQNETPEAVRAGETYLFIAVIGGLAMLTGLFLLYRACGTLALDAQAVGAIGEVELGNALGRIRLRTERGCTGEQRAFLLEGEAGDDVFVGHDNPFSQDTPWKMIRDNLDREALLT